MRYFFPFLVCGLFSPYLSVFANTPNPQDDRRLQDEKLYQHTLSIPQQSEPTTPTHTENHTIHLNIEQLLQNPALLQHTLLSALTYHHVENVVYLFEFYQQLDKKQQNPFLFTWADAVKAEYQGNYQQAIQNYQQLLKTYPQNDLFHLRYAFVLHQQGYRKEAEQQLNYLINKENLPPALKKNLDNVNAHLRASQRWQWSADLNYIQDNNLNNAPQNKYINQNLTAQDSQSAHGLQLAVGTQKINLLRYGKFHDFRWATYYKYYWNQQHYNDLSSRISTGLGQFFPRGSLVILPFFEKNWYAGGTPQQHQLKPFSESQGVTLEFKKQFHDQWHAAIYAEYAKNQYRTRQHLNGFGQTLVSSLTYTANPQRYYRISTEYQRITSQDADDSFKRAGLRLGVGQLWQTGLTTNASAYYAHRRYQGVMPIFNQTQHSHDYGLSASVGHQRLQWRGIQPRLTWQYQKVDSNILLYQYDKQRIFLEFSKQF